MNGDTYDDPPERRFPAVTELCRRYPMAFAGYRISHLVEHDRDISESGEIPLVTTPAFPVAILGYLLVARVTYLVARLLGRPDATDVGSPDHVFSMTSTQGYRTHTFLEVAEACVERGESVAFLCSPAAASERDAWEATGFETVTHRELHGRVGIGAVLWSVVRAAVVTIRLVRETDVQSGLLNYVRYYNFVLLEHIKRESVAPLVADDPVVHTYSPMPYLVDAAGNDRIFVYQHGIQQPIGGKIMAAPFYVPLTYLVWGDPWKANFQRYVHSDSTVLAVGSPWYDYLAEQAETADDPTTDVLLVSDSHGLTDAIEPAFERLVRELIEACDEGGYSLAVKLHPLEDESWYEAHGWGEYVTAYDDIDDALLDTRVSVVNTSTAFVESAVLGVPVVVGDLWDRGLSALAPVDNVRFTDGPAVGEAVRIALDDPDAFRDSDGRSLVRLGGSTRRILDAVDDRRTELDGRADPSPVAG